MPPYRMQTVLEMRERAEEEAKQAFSDATQAVVKARAEQKRLEDDLERRKAERKQRVEAYLQEIVQRTTGIAGMNQMYRFEQRLKDEEAQVALDIEKQKLVVKAAEKLLEQRRMEMAEAAKELKAIEKHKEKWAKEVKAERDKREDLSQEEIGNALYLARSRKN